jgi:hypothetical protein
LIAAAHQGSFFGIIPEPKFELVVAKLLEDDGLVPAGFGFQFSTSTRSPTSISAQLVDRFGWGWLLAVACCCGAAAAGASPFGGSALVGLSASSFSYSGRASQRKVSERQI